MPHHWGLICPQLFCNIVVGPLNQSLYNKPRNTIISAGQAVEHSQQYPTSNLKTMVDGSPRISNL